MKRHPDLIHLSREHHQALVLARRARTLDAASPEARQWLQDFRPIWTESLLPHFAQEESQLPPVLNTPEAGPAIWQLLNEHAMLRSLAAQLLAGQAQWIQPFGQRLEDHVRFEERELFPLYQQQVEQQLNAEAQPAKTE